jgi:two-component system chemotaxis sensor kinase CheA
MDKDRLAQRLMATFIVELENYVRTFEQDLLALEKNPAPDARTDLFGSLLRTAHSLKGAARSVKVDLLETASHRLEEVFIAARDGDLKTDGAFFNVLLPTIDAVGDVALRLKTEGRLTNAPLVEELPRLTGLLTGETNPRRPNQSEPTSPGAPSPRQRIDAVRVANDKLDALLRQSGELLVVRHRAEARSEDASKLQDILADWRKAWRHVEQGIADLLKRGSEAEEAPNGTGAKSRAARSNLMELAVNRSRDGLWRLERSLQRFAADLTVDRRAIEQTAGPLDAMVRQTRMFPFAEACEGLERVARDLSVSGNKKVHLVIEGGEIELDRSVLESIKDPLLHLVRNAVDHGIEPVAMRRMANKPEVARITVTAALRGTRVEIRVSDDGKGLDLAAIIERLRGAGRPVPTEERELMRCIFQPGFTTSPRVTQVSGRGVGLDVVNTQLAAVRGVVDVSFVPGAGTVFTLSVPLTLTSIRAILVGVGDDIYAVDTASVDRVLRVGAGDIRSVGGREMLLLSGVPIPVITLAELVGAPGQSLTETSKVSAIVLSAAGRLAALAVDTLHAEREVVIRALGPRLRQVAGVAGGTILPNGRIALILNAAELVEQVIASPSKGLLADTAAGAQGAIRKRLLVVDDSATIRTLEKSILEAAGYDVTIAADGQEAWHLLLEMGADLVVSDVEMPRMDGFSLTETIRGSKRFRDLPVVLVTAMESEADKARGMAVGATAYRLKSAFDQKDLLATIEQIL